MSGKVNIAEGVSERRERVNEAESGSDGLRKVVVPRKETGNDSIIPGGCSECGSPIPPLCTVLSYENGGEAVGVLIECPGCGDLMDLG